MFESQFYKGSSMMLIQLSQHIVPKHAFQNSDQTWGGTFGKQAMENYHTYISTLSTLIPQEVVASSNTVYTKYNFLICPSRQKYLHLHSLHLDAPGRGGFIQNYLYKRKDDIQFYWIRRLLIVWSFEVIWRHFFYKRKDDIQFYWIRRLDSCGQKKKKQGRYEAKKRAQNQCAQQI